ncbi:MAG TPA: STAS domain-containing protein [Catenuloplanes sp.]|jgi:anti-anti-sigma factor
MSHEKVSPARPTDRYRDPHLTLQMSRSGPVTLVSVRGEVDTDNAHLIPELVDSLTSNASQRVLLDLANVTFLSAAGVEALLRVRDIVAGKAGQLIVRDPAPIVLTVFAGTRVTRGFQIHTSPQRDAGPAIVPAARRPVG